ncbi:hypothetical protein PFLUV_G00059440 [Perca fluviatilis]|uniref:Uncharacterized protein n=1 Tax=Perca fluviatilis TaxID=8168 RepID=A0A6A5FJY9_PERFL|nr:hypothetical protein PFLUV_G00059440 [Perca fluviatilis]
MARSSPENKVPQQFLSAKKSLTAHSCTRRKANLDAAIVTSALRPPENDTQTIGLLSLFLTPEPSGILPNQHKQ